MRFYTGRCFRRVPQSHLHREHGSWNRSKKSGYRVMQAKVEGGKVVEYGVLRRGLPRQGERQRVGRPVDIQVMPDGALLVSDDHANAIYRIAYRK